MGVPIGTLCHHLVHYLVGLDDGVTVATPCRVFKSLLGLILGCLIPCLGYYSSDSSFFFALEGGVHTVEKGTRHFGVRQFSSYLTLCFFAIFCNKIF